MTAGHWGAATLTANLAGIVAKARDAVQSLAFKTMLALGAAALPALAVAAFLGSTPIALFGALIAMAFGVWMIRLYFLLPVTRLTDHVLRIRESGQLDVWANDHMSARADEIGTLARSFDLVLAELTEARKSLIAWSEAEISKQYERLDGVINNMSQGVCMYDAEQKLIIANRRYAELYGLPPEYTVPGTPLRKVLEHRVATHGSFETNEDFVSSRLAAVAMGKPWYHVNELPDGRVIAVSHLPLANGCSIGTHEDITERRKAQAQIEFMAHHDVLTRLPNRVRFREQMEAALAGVRRGQVVAVLCLDLDHFKAVNDTLGHPVGDALLQAVADRIRACVRPTDSVARLGGDEFAIVQTLADQPTGSTALAVRMIEKLSTPFDVHGHQVVISASVGIAIAPNDGDDPDCLLKNADMALYRAKEDGRGIHRYFEPAMDARMQARRILELDLRKAFALGEFELFYQPLVRLDTNEVSGLEALLRWRHPQRGLVPPSEFIPLAEEIGLIGVLGAWVLKHACHDAATWPDNLRVAVNLSPVQFKSGTVVLDVIAALGASGLPAGRLELEITEAVLLQDTESTVATLSSLRDLGVSISMDDFGTGYSSLGYLRKFPFDKIKIDGSFIRDMSERPDSVAIVRAVAGLGSSLGISTTAEGVETEEQLQRLRDEGCTEVQGYLFSKPIPADEVRLLLQRLAPRSKAVA
jgi:diguanylate cyclase (GGDEF)-like protein